MGKLPLNVKFIIEGEEEIGSGNLDEFVSKNQEMLKCDAVMISDTSLYGPRHSNFNLWITRSLLYGS